jgi:hypothetical protein
MHFALQLLLGLIAVAVIALTLGWLAMKFMDWVDRKWPTEYSVAYEPEEMDLADPSNPASPLNPCNPASPLNTCNPCNPISPLNPINHR